jgi:hypothetical protein
MPHRASLRASDTDRDEVTERLRRATAEGRLRPDELEHRLGTALSASTYGELDALVADLPRVPDHRRARPHVPGPLWARGVLVVAVMVAALAAVAIAALVVAGLVAVWALWLAMGWLLFGHRYRRGWDRRGMCSRGRRRTSRGRSASSGTVGGFTPWL